VRRRAAILAAGLVTLVALSSVQAQTTGRISRIGYLLQPPLADPPTVERAAFLAALRELGHVEGKSILIEYRSAGGNPELLPDLAEELVRLKVDVILTVGPLAAKAAKEATTTIPIVVAAAPDPVGTGLVASLARPGGNVTGLTLTAPELSAKRLQLLKEVAPRAARVAVLWNPEGPGALLELNATQAVAPALGITLQALEVRNPEELFRVFETLSRRRPDALTMFMEPRTATYRQLVAEFAIKHRLPTMFGWAEFVTAGGLISYSPTMVELFRRAAVYVDKILKGARPSDLPIEQPTKFELVVNLRTAKAVGLTIPQSILLRAERVIE